MTGYADAGDRNTQFENIAALREKYISNGKPVIAVDTKKTELIGLLYRDGKLHSQEDKQVYDHDYPKLARGKAIPQSIYDYAANKGFENIGPVQRPHNSSAMGSRVGGAGWAAMITLDAGGSSRAHCNVFKEKLAALSDKIGMKIRIAHYPPYTSKWHPIEHRLFPHMTRALSGVILKSIEMVRELIEKAHTSTDLWVRAHVLDKVYPTGEKCSVKGKERALKRILRDSLLPYWISC